jgi:putative transposase
MGQSLSKNYIHIIFSTKNRYPFIRSEYEDQLFRYLGGVCRNMNCPSLIVGGYLDHVHILSLLSKKVTLVSLLEQLKTESSKWMKTLSPDLKDFYWQDGYGAFSVNPAQVEVVSNYILRQKEHHTEKSFQDEYRSFLKKYKVDYDEKYVWD